MIYSDLGIGCSQTSNCASANGCPEGVRPDFCIKRNDTTPSFKVAVEDCSGVVDLSGNYSLEVNIWIKSKLKSAIASTDTELKFADNVGFEQIKQNNILVMSRARSPEKMLITSFNEEQKTITVQRGYDGTTAQDWAKGSELRVFRAIDVEGEIELVYEDVSKLDGTTENELVSTFLVYTFTEETSCFSGCYWLEFKLIEFDEDLATIISTRRFPSEGEGFLVKITDSPTGD